MSYTVKPKKSLGQHFLTDENIARSIADTLDNYPNTPILEVGPGMGVLTRYLTAKKHDLTVVELDHESVEYLQEHFPELEGRIVEKDFLKMLLKECQIYLKIQKRCANEKLLPAFYFENTTRDVKQTRLHSKQQWKNKKQRN